MANADKFFDQSLGNFQEELELAEEEGKKGILLFFEMDDCPFCEKMKTKILNQAKVQKYFKDNFLIFSVDIEGDIEINDFQGEAVLQKDFALYRYRIRATPVIVFHDLKGKVTTRYIGATKNAEEFMWLGEYVVDQHYLKSSFSRFKRKKRQQVK